MHVLEKEFIQNIYTETLFPNQFFEISTLSETSTICIILISLYIFMSKFYIEYNNTFDKVDFIQHLLCWTYLCYSITWIIKFDFTQLLHFSEIRKIVKSYELSLNFLLSMKMANAEEQLSADATSSDNVIFRNQIKINEGNSRFQEKNPVSKRI